MSSSHLVDREILPLLELFGDTTLTAETLPEIRERKVEFPPADPDGVSVRRVMIPGRDGDPDVPLDVYHPAGRTENLACIYHIHGGGFVSGSLEADAFALRAFTARLGCVIISVGYRLAPETRFPGAIEDCYAGLAWTMNNAAALGISADRIGVMGESAGGGLAASLSLLVRDRGEFALAFQHLVYPMLDDRTCIADPHPYTGEFVWTANSNKFGWNALLGHEPGTEGVSPYAAAARAENLDGLPPAFISTAALDLFVEENLDYARRLIRARVPTELHVYPGAFHGFDVVPGSAVADAARADRLDALRRAIRQSERSEP